MPIQYLIKLRRRLYGVTPYALHIVYPLHLLQDLLALHLGDLRGRGDPGLGLGLRGILDYDG